MQTFAMLFLAVCLVYAESDYWSGVFREGMFPVAPLDDRLPAKQRVLGVWSGEGARAYPLSAFGPDLQTIRQTLNGRELTLRYDSDAKSLRIVQAEDGLQWVYSFWFAWYAFHPRTEIFGQGR